MNQNNNRGYFCSTTGFTLIELLVVVLIIGILAAVAVPQYQLAVKRAAFMNLMYIGSVLEQAERRYYLATSEYTCDIDKLDIAVNTSDINISCVGGSGTGWYQYWSLQAKRGGPSLRVFWVNGGRWCVVVSNGADADKKFCDKITGHTGVQASYYYSQF